ncbi:MAG: superinfection exclusion B family protein [Acidobacteria bacterium]|nr:superinfection exclusion B family protein [Acidobacteriota bacterium]
MDVTKVLDWVQLKPRYLFAIAVVTGLVLWIPSEFVVDLGLRDFREQWRPWIGVVFLAAAVLWIVHFAALGIAAVQKPCQAESKSAADEGTHESPQS